MWWGTRNRGCTAANQGGRSWSGHCQAGSSNIGDQRQYHTQVGQCRSAARFLRWSKGSAEPFDHVRSTPAGIRRCWLTKRGLLTLTQKYVSERGLGGVVLSLRSAVIALVASVALVLVLAGVCAGVFTPPSPEPPIPQAASVDPPVVARQAAPVDPPVAAPQPDPGNSPVAAPHSTPVHREPVADPTSYGRVPVHRHPAPAADPPASVAPVPAHRPVSPPPFSALPAQNSKSRTVNTEPCACDGTMRKVPTHWDPPQA